MNPVVPHTDSTESIRNPRLDGPEANGGWHSALYRAVMDTAVEAILVIDDREDIQSVNWAVTEIFGYAPSELFGRSITMLLPPSRVRDLDRPEQHCHATGERKGTETGCRVLGKRKDGSEFPATLSVREWHSENNRQFFAAIVRDLTRNHAMMAARDENRGEFRTASETALVGLIVLDTDHRIQFANQASAVLLGRSLDTLPGCSLTEVLPHRCRFDIRQHLEAAFSGGGGSYPITVLDACGLDGKRHLTATFEPSRNARGDAVAIMVITDVTALKRRECELTSNRDLLQSVLDGTLDAVFAKNKAGRYIVLNEAGATLIGRTRAEAIGQTDHQLFPPHAADELRRQDRLVIASGQASRHERVLIVDGEERRFVVTLRPWMDPNGESCGIVGIAQDVTAQRSLTEERRTIARRLVHAQERERMKIARDLHDQVGQEITGLALGLKSLERDLERDPVGLTKLSRLRDLTNRIGKNIHRDAMALRAPALDDLGLRQAIASHVNDLIERFHMTIDLDLAALDACELDVDAQLAMYRGIQEALTNVLKHASASTVRIVAQHLGDQLRLLIQDDGRGFDVDAPRKPSALGGLGLIGIHERLSLVGGEMRIESAPGQGTSMILNIPTSRKIAS